MSQQRDRAALEAVFPDLKPETLDAIYAMAQVESYAPGTRLCVEGQAGDILYILVEGRAEVSKYMEGEIQPIDYLGANTCFGEIGFILGVPRTADVAVIETARVIEINQAAFREHIRTNPETILSLAQMVLKRMLKQQDIMLTQLARHEQRNTAPRVFLSYARADEEFAERLVYRLKRHKIEVWMDQHNLAPGMNWARAIGQALDDCQAMILLLSPHAVTSDRVEEEWMFFLSEKKMIVPLVIEDCVIPYQLRPLHQVKFTAANFDTALARLIAQLHSLQVESI